MTRDDELRNDALIEELRTAGRAIDPVPDKVVFAAKGSLAWRTIDAELAELTFDSALDDAQFELVRGAGEARLLVFKGPDLTVEVEVIAFGSAYRIVGELVPGRAARVEVRHANGSSRTDSDGRGRFTVDQVPRGPVSIRCEFMSDGRASTLETDWITL